VMDSDLNDKDKFSIIVKFLDNKSIKHNISHYCNILAHKFGFIWGIYGYDTTNYYDDFGWNLQNSEKLINANVQYVKYINKLIEHPEFDIDTKCVKITRNSTTIFDYCLTCVCECSIHCNNSQQGERQLHEIIIMLENMILLQGNTTHETHNNGYYFNKIVSFGVPSLVQCALENMFITDLDVVAVNPFI